MSVVKRIKEYLDFKGITNQKFEIEIGYSNGAFGTQLNNNKTIGSDKLENILITYKDLSSDWLLTGSGKMIKNELNNSHIELWEKERDILRLQIETLKDKDQLQSKVIELYNNLNGELKLRIENLEKEISELKQSTSEPILYRSVAEPAPQLIKKEPK